MKKVSKKNPNRRLYILLTLLCLTCLFALAANLIMKPIAERELDSTPYLIVNQNTNETELEDETTRPQSPETNKNLNLNKNSNTNSNTQKLPVSQATPTTVTSSRPTISPLSKEVSIGNINKKQIAITLDAGASPEWTPAVLDILKENKLHVTFFLTGKWIEQNPGIVRRMINEGHSFGNHTYDHKDLTTLTDDQIAGEFAMTEAAMKKVNNSAVLKPYFRPPYGARNKHVWEYAASIGYQSIYWTIDAFDWQTNATPEIVKNRIYDQATNGAIILMHLGDEITPAVLPEVIQKLQSEGYKIGRLEDVL